MAKRIRVGLVGAGVFASYHASKIAASAQTEFTGIFDPDSSRAKALAEQYDTQMFANHAALIAKCDAIIVASPAKTHGALAHEILSGGRHVLVEKPLALNGKEALKLAQMAQAANLVLQVGHQERLVCAALGLFDIIEPVRSIRMLRAGPPPSGGRAMDVSVIWDLMIHDIDLAHRLLGSKAIDRACKGMRELGSELDRAIATMRIGDTSVQFEASRVSKDRQRMLHLTYDSGEIELDFLARTVRNSSDHIVAENLVDLVPDPLGAADELFFRACRFGEEALMRSMEAAYAVATAETFESLALEEMGI